MSKLDGDAFVVARGLPVSLSGFVSMGEEAQFAGFPPRSYISTSLVGIYLCVEGPAGSKEMRSRLKDAERMLQKTLSDLLNQMNPNSQMGD